MKWVGNSNIFSPRKRKRLKRCRKSHERRFLGTASGRGRKSSVSVWDGRSSSSIESLAGKKPKAWKITLIRLWSPSSLANRTDTNWKSKCRFSQLVEKRLGKWVRLELTSVQPDRCSLLLTLLRIGIGNPRLSFLAPTASWIISTSRYKFIKMDEKF